MYLLGRLPVKGYFNKIDSAEVSLINGKFEESMSLYSEAFRIGDEEDILFLKDIHNALLLAFKTKDIPFFKDFISYLSRYNIDDSFIDVLEKLGLKGTPFDSIVKSQLVQESEKFETSAVCYTFKKLSVLDQSIRKACSGQPRSMYSYCGEEISLLDSFILRQLQKHFEDHGFPKEYEFCDQSASHTLPPYSLIVKHNLQWCRTYLLETLRENIGSVHPYVYADIMNYYYNNPCDGSSYDDPLGMSYHFQLGGDLYILSLPKDEERLNRINRNRRAIYLDSVQSFLKKLKFQHFNPEYLFIYPQFIQDLNLSEAFEKKLMEKYKEFKVTEKGE